MFVGAYDAHFVKDIFKRICTFGWVSLLMFILRLFDHEMEQIRSRGCLFSDPNRHILFESSKRNQVKQYELRLSTLLLNYLAVCMFSFSDLFFDHLDLEELRHVPRNYDTHQIIFFSIHRRLQSDRRISRSGMICRFFFLNRLK